MTNNLPYCQIFDLDGTLAIRGDRGPYDWSRVGEDRVNENVAYLTKCAHADKDVVIIVSGRSDICRPETEEWLYDNWQLIHNQLWMRKEGDNRCDTIVKRELYDTHIKDKYRVRFVVDDRPKVCRMWRELGLTVLQVGDPYNEF